MSIIVNFEETPPKYEDVMNKFAKKNVKIKENNLTLENRNKWTKDIWDIKARLPEEVDICGDDEWEFDRLFYVNHKTKETSWNPFTWGDNNQPVKSTQPFGLSSKAAIKRRASNSIRKQEI